MIKARKLTKRFGEVEALTNLNCNIPQGCIYGLVGANGAGKSTFLRLCNGIYQPDDGHSPSTAERFSITPAVKEHCVFVPDELYFLPQSNLKPDVASL